MNNLTNNKNYLDKAKNYAFLLLKFRQRSVKEIQQRLRRKKFEPGIIKEVICFLQDKNFLDDNLFAKAWINSRLKRPLGIRRIKQELKIKGIDSEIITDQIEEVKKDYNEEKIVSEIARKKFSNLKALEPIKARQRIYSYLLRRGFSSDVVNETISRL